jgi:thiamine-phosphate pyrophosphorylase
MKLIAYSNACFTPGEAQILSRILPWVDGLHIRKEEAMSLERWRKLLEELPKEYASRIWIHEHHELALEFKLAGIHISRKARQDNPGLGVYAALHNLKASISCHQIEQAPKLVDIYERVIFSPVCDSISKPGHAATFDPNDLRTFLSGSHEAECIALGGVDLYNAEEIMNLGFDGLAVLGSLWTADNPVDYIKKMHAKCQGQPTTY